MRAFLPTAGEAASFPPVQPDSESQQPPKCESDKTSTVQTDSDENAWFSVPARVLLGSDPGLALHVLTGVSESSGRRYASGERGIPGNLLRDLQRGKHGQQWTAATLDGCEWWKEYQRVHEIGARVLAITK
jgi:hypothetical protein